MRRFFLGGEGKSLSLGPTLWSPTHSAGTPRNVPEVSEEVVSTVLARSHGSRAKTDEERALNGKAELSAGVSAWEMCCAPFPGIFSSGIELNAGSQSDLKELEESLRIGVH